MRKISHSEWGPPIARDTTTARYTRRHRRSTMRRLRWQPSASSGRVGRASPSYLMTSFGRRLGATDRRRVSCFERGPPIARENTTAGDVPRQRRSSLRRLRWLPSASSGKLDWACHNGPTACRAQPRRIGIQRSRPLMYSKRACAVDSKRQIEAGLEDHWRG